MDVTAYEHTAQHLYVGNLRSTRVGVKRIDVSVSHLQDGGEDVLTRLVW